MSEAIGVLVAREKAAIDDGAGHSSSVGECGGVRVGVCLRVGREEDISDAAR